MGTGKAVISRVITPISRVITQVTHLFPAIFFGAHRFFLGSRLPRLASDLVQMELWKSANRLLAFDELNWYPLVN